MVHLLRFAQLPTHMDIRCAGRLFRSSAAARCVSFARKVVTISVEQAFALREDNDLEVNAAVVPNIIEQVSSTYLGSQAAHLQRCLIDRCRREAVVQLWPPPP